MAFVLFVSIVGYKFAFVHLELLKLVIAPVAGIFWLLMLLLSAV
jgi:hypothetical protein